MRRNSRRPSQVKEAEDEGKLTKSRERRPPTRCEAAGVEGMERKLQSVRAASKNRGWLNWLKIAERLWKANESPYPWLRIFGSVKVQGASYLEDIVMRYFAAFVVLTWAGLMCPGMGGEARGPGQEREVADSRVPVVVELFTSEGCSTCPPADALLTELERRQPFKNVEIIGLEEHVDYWDQQGWIDPFSSSEWTSRQYTYDRAMKNSNPYTPEMVVDGRDEFIGSHTGKARQAIESAAAMKKCKVSLSEVSPPQNKKEVTLDIGVEKLPASTPGDTPEVLLAITEAELHSKVTAGENSGRELHHAPVLRELKVIGAAGKSGSEGFAAHRTVKLNSSWKLENLLAIVWVQEKKSRHILGAAEMRIEAAGADAKAR